MHKRTYETKIIIILLSFFLNIIGADAQTATSQQQAYINNLTQQQLADLSAEQLVETLDNVLRSRGTNVLNNLDIKTSLKFCLSNYYSNNFTTDDLRILFIQPPNMDYNYYNQKIMNVQQYLQSVCLKQVGISME